MKVFINPGHMPRQDSGAVSPRTGLQECDVALSVGKLTKGYLEAAGCECRLLQADSLWEITRESNNWEADVFISLHCNAVEDTSANGAECWHFYASREGKKLSQCIQSQLVDSLPLTDRGVKPAKPGENGLYVLTNTDAIASLVEMAFISNEEDEQILRTHQNELARAIARGVTDYELMREW